MVVLDGLSDVGDWIVSLPWTEIGIGIGIAGGLAGLGGLVLGIMAYFRSTSYIEIDEDDWKFYYHGPTREVTVVGRITKQTPAAKIDGSCETRIGKRKLKLPLVDASPHLRYNADVVRFEAIEDIDHIDPQLPELTAKITVWLSDGKRKTKKVTISDLDVRRPRREISGVRA